MRFKLDVSKLQNEDNHGTAPQDFGEEQMKQSHSHPAQCLAGGSAG